MKKSYLAIWISLIVVMALLSIIIVGAESKQIGTGRIGLKSDEKVLSDLKEKLKSNSKIN